VKKLNSSLLDLIDLNEIRKEKARRNLLDFTKYTMSEYQTNWHHKAICSYLDRWAFGDIDRLMIFCPPQNGKALKLNTPIPTPDGWTTIGDLKIYDQVFDENGNICNVIAKSNIFKNRQVYKVITNHGSDEIIADGEHDWLVSLWGHRSIIKNTRNLAERTSSEKPTIKIQGALQLPEKELSIDPYVLGVWLGDGNPGSAIITQGGDDYDWMRNEIEKYYKTSDQSTQGTFGILGLQKQLRISGLLNNKHIPKIYFRSSIEQRLSLLQGLIDTDGYVSATGEIEFTNINPDIAFGLVELVNSLGCKASIYPFMSTLYGVEKSLCFRITFFMANAARMPRKRKNCRDAKKYKNIQITVIPFGHADTQCIQVDSKSGMFLCGRTMVPTHNSELVSRRLPAYIFGRNPDAKIIATSYGADLASSMNRDVQRIIESEKYQELFPETQLYGKNVVTVARGSYLRNNEIFEIINKKGRYKCAGTGGPITGHGFQYGIIDDPIKSRAEADSPTFRNTTWSWYTSDFYTRCSKRAKILLTVTRWNLDDLPGRLIRQMETNEIADKWVVAAFPAIADGKLDSLDPREQGDPLWPDRYPLDFLKKVKAQSPYDWMSMYQQTPVDPGTQVFSPDEMVTLDPASVNLGFSEIYCACDPSEGGNDSAAIVILVVMQDGNWLVWEADLSIDNQLTTIKKLVGYQKQYNFKRVWIEQNSLGHAKNAPGKSTFEMELIRMLQQEKVAMPYVFIWNSSNKVDRIRSIQPYYQQGKLLFRNDHVKVHPEMDTQLRLFPNYHDDGPDALEMCVRGVIEKDRAIKIPRLTMPVIRSLGWPG
jgi:predicted phage terminase large subunit-like protein